MGTVSNDTADAVVRITTGDADAVNGEGGSGGGSGIRWKGSGKTADSDGAAGRVDDRVETRFEAEERELRGNPHTFLDQVCN